MKLIKYPFLWCLFVFAFQAKSSTSFNCPIADWNPQQIKQYVDNQYQPLGEPLDAFALNLIGCLASPTNSVRDDMAYMSYVHWLREGKLDTKTVISLYQQLFADIKMKRNDEHQVYLPFAVLVFSEVIRVDRIKRYLSDEQFASSVAMISELLQTTEDFRGFDNDMGWRHLVAHSADVSLQLVLNKRLSVSELELLVSALFSKIAPTNHSYTFGESKRLMMPILYAWLSGKQSMENWNSWLERISAPEPFDTWQAVYRSEAGLHKLHNTRQFLLELHYVVTANDLEQLKPIAPSIKQALAKLK